MSIPIGRLSAAITQAAEAARRKSGIGRAFEPADKQSLTAGHLEPDTFYINDVLLRIPPTEIHVDKQAFNHEWTTLRTQQTRQTKSGYSIARVGFEVIFKNGSDFANLAKVVAGLRATPFCTIRNEYLSKVLGRPDSTPPTQGDFEPQYRMFQPIMLGLSSMTFSTMGHEGKPDCIRGVFDFVWFNYFPYTPIVAYKTGQTLEGIGEADDSPLWKAFYEPFLDNVEIPSYPHMPGTDPASVFMWREFALLPKGDPSANKAALALVKAAQGNKESVVEELTKIQSEIASGDAAPSSMSSEVLDILFKKLIKKGSINPDQELQNSLKTLESGAITNAAGGIVGPALQKLGNPNIPVRDKQRDLDSAAIMLAEKIEKEKKAQQLSQKGVEGFRKVLDTEANYAIKSDKFSAGGMELWGRKKFLRITHQQYDGGEVGPVIQQITISFENTLASIPMVGYKYPTLQHLGSMNTRINILINARNYRGAGKVSDVESICRMYDSIETMALQYRQIPQGFGNLYINNDFLKLFGVTECITNQLTVSTLQGLPGRSLISLSLSENGITSNTKIQDNPENLEQEYVAGDTAIYKKCWDIIRKYLTPVKTNRNSFSDNLFSPADTGYYYLAKTNIPAGDQSKLLNSIVSEAASAYNTFVNTAHKKLFSGSGIGDRLPGYAAAAVLSGGAFPAVVSGAITAEIAKPGSPGPNEVNLYFKALDSVTENDPLIGWTPGLNSFKDDVEYRAKTLYGQDRRKYDPNGNNNKILQNEIAALKSTIEATNDPAVKKQLIAKKDLFESGLKYNRLNIQELGIEVYQAKMRSLFQKILKWGTDLDQFKEVKNMKENLGLSKGLFAYPDFKKQISSVASWCGDKKVDNSTLMKYEPDCYFWYPLVDGGASSPSFGLIDPLYKIRARDFSSQIFDAAQNDVGDFFSKEYRNRLRKDKGTAGNIVSSALDGYANALGKSREKMALPLYDGVYFFNSSATQDLVKDPGDPDPSKAQAHQVLEATPINCPNKLVSSTNIHEHWTGINPEKVSPKSEINVPGDNPNQAPIPPPPGGPKTLNNKDDIVRIIIDNCPSGFPVGLAVGVAQEESSLNPNKKGGAGGNFYGLFQIGIKYLGKNGYKIDAKDLFDPAKNTSAALQSNTPLVKGYQMAKSAKLPDFDCFAIAYLSHNAGRQHVVNAMNAAPRPLSWAGIKEAFIRLKSYGDRTEPKANYAEGVAKVSLKWQEKISGIRKSKAGRVAPSALAKEQASKRAQSAPGTDVASTTGGVLDQAINEFEKELLLGQGQSMMRAYPAFKLYFIEDDSGERRRLGFDDFFSYNAVQSIRIIRSRKIAADLCEIYLTNISGVLSNRRFRQKGMEIDPITGLPKSTGNKPHQADGTVTKEKPSTMKGDTRDENPIASLLLQEGIDIHVKLGYSSDPDKLDDAFTGTITEIEFSESDDLVRILAQSHAIELVQDIKGVEGPQTKRAWAPFNWTSWILPQGATTAKLLSEFISSPETVHFGRWRAKDGLSSNQWREILTDRWTYQPRPQDDNIFAPSPQDEMKLLGGGVALKTLNYIIYRTTIWDIFQEMTLRHPNFIASPVPYKCQTGWRMTMFYGLPNQLYFARDPRTDEQLADERIKAGTDQLNSKTIEQLGKETEKTKLLKAAGQAISGAILKWSPLRPVAQITESIVQNKSIGDLLTDKIRQKVAADLAAKNLRISRLNQGLSTGWIKPFRSYHLVTSKQHIVANNITANARDVANTIVVKYGRKVVVEKGAAGTLDKIKELKSTEDETFVLKLDCALPPEEVRTQLAQFINVDNEEVAKRYALGLLMRNLKEIYKGELIVLGNAKIKPYDVVYIFDEYTDMVGAIEVEEAQIVFDHQMGYRTEIKPDMLVQAGEWSLLTSAEALGIISEEMLKKMGGYGPLALGPLGAALGAVQQAPGRTQMSLLPWIMGQAASAYGGFLGNKILTYTQLAYPVVMSPLQHHGKIFAGGVPTRKLPVSTWTTFFGKWASSIDVGYQAWLEDLKAGMLGWITETTGQHQLGDFWDNGDSNPIQ